MLSTQNITLNRQQRYTSNRGVITSLQMLTFQGAIPRCIDVKNVSVPQKYFSTLVKKVKYKVILPTSKKNLDQLFDFIFQHHPVLGLTLLNQKPAVLIDIPEQLYQVAYKKRRLIETSNIKLVFMDTIKGQTSLLGNWGKVYFMNLDLINKIINQNIDYFRMRLNNAHLNSKQILSLLLKDNSPLKNMKSYGDLIGIALGYPLNDVVLFKTYTDLIDKLKFLPHNSPHNKLLSTLRYLIYPPTKASDPKNFYEIYKDGQKVNLPNAKPFFDVTEHFPFFNFVSWDNTSAKALDFKQKYHKMTKNIKAQFKTFTDYQNTVI